MSGAVRLREAGSEQFVRWVQDLHRELNARLNREASDLHPSPSYRPLRFRSE